MKIDENEAIQQLIEFGKTLCAKVTKELNKYESFSSVTKESWQDGQGRKFSYPIFQRYSGIFESLGDYKDDLKERGLIIPRACGIYWKCPTLPDTQEQLEILKRTILLKAYLEARDAWKTEYKKFNNFTHLTLEPNNQPDGTEFDPEKHWGGEFAIDITPEDELFLKIKFCWAPKTKTL